MKTKTFKNQTPINSMEEAEKINKDILLKEYEYTSELLQEVIDNGKYISLWLAFQSQNLSEDFITKNNDNYAPYWDTISSYQNLSEDFINENKDKINFYFLQKNQYCSDSVKAKFIHLLPRMVELDDTQTALNKTLLIDAAKDELSDLFKSMTKEVILFYSELGNWTKIINIANPTLRNYFSKVIAVDGIHHNYKNVKVMVEGWIKEFYQAAKANNTLTV